MSSNVTNVAFVTSTALAIGTGLAVVGAATTTSMTAAIALAILATLGAALSIASISVYFSGPHSTDDYFKRFGEHTKFAVAGMTQFIAHVLYQNMVAAAGDAVRTLFFECLMGRRRYA